MGSHIEFNDTLQITREQGFPSHIFDRSSHVRHPVRLDQVAGQIFEFKDKSDARIFHTDPVRVYLVENTGGKWLFWGRVLIESQTIEKKLDAHGKKWDGRSWKTRGLYRIVDVYDPHYQEIFTRREAPPDRNYFGT
jgi:hypothetical protein